jgi:hypothetical protein
MGDRTALEAVGTVMHKCLQLACAGLERGHSNQLAR